MTKRPPWAAIWFYTLAVVLAIVGVITICVGLLGSAAATNARDPLQFGQLLGGSLVVFGLGEIFGAVGIAAVGVIAHDIHRIQENTARTAAALEAGGSTPMAPPAAARGPAVFFYFEKGIERGPVSGAELSALIRTSQVNVFQRIETSVGGVRRPFEMADLEA